MIEYILIAIVSYFLGSIPFAQIIVGTRKINLKKVGSGNIGTMNTLRSTNSIWLALIVLIFDAGKGAVSILLAQYLSNYFSIDLKMAILIAAFFVVVGHNWSMFENFRSGRGIATSMGVSLLINWRLIIVWIAIWLIGALPTKIFSFGQILAALFTPLAVYVLGFDKFYVYLATVLCIPMFVAHVPKIPLILSGKEPKMYYKTRKKKRVKKSKR